MHTPKHERTLKKGYEYLHEYKKEILRWIAGGMLYFSLVKSVEFCFRCKRLVRSRCTTFLPKELSDAKECARIPCR